MAKTIFDILNDLTKNKVRWEDQTPQDQKSFNPYMINRFLSMDKDLVDIVNEIQVYSSNISPEMLYRIYFDILPKTRFFAKYINVKSTEQFESLKSFFMDNWQLSATDVENILKRSDNPDIILEIQKYTGQSEKEIKKQYKL